MPVRELAAKEWDAVVVGGGHNGLTAAAYLARAGQVGARARSARPARRRVHARRAVRRPRLQGEPVRVRRRPARPPGDRRAGACASTATTSSSPIPASGARSTTARRTRSSSTTTGRSRTCATTASPTPTSKASSPTRTSSTACARRSAKDRRDAWQGDAPDRAELEDLLGHDRELIDVLFEASIADVTARFCKDERLHTALTARASSARGPGPAIPAPLRSSSCTSRASSRACRWHGATSKAAWAGSRSRSPKRPRSSAPSLATGTRVAEILPGERRRARRRRPAPRPTRHLQRRPQGHRAPLRRRRPARVHGEGRRLARPEPGPQAELRPLATAAVDRRARRRLPEPRARLDRAPDRRSPTGVRRLHQRHPAARLRRAVLPDRVRPVGRARGQAHHERRSCSTRRTRSPKATGTSRRDEIGNMVLDLIARFSPDVKDCVDDIDVLGPPDIEATHRPHRRPHLPGRVHARPDVVEPLRAPHADGGRLPLRRGDPSRRQRHRAQRPQRRDGRPRRPRRAE